MFLWLLGVLACIVIILFLGWLTILLVSDADVSLILKTKFGKQPESLAGKVVWVTGASSGIGEYIAYCLAESGCKLVLSARRKGELERVKKACLASAKCKVQEEDILVLPLDLLDFESHHKKVQEALEYFNKIDILINNAGRAQRALWMDVDLSVDRDLFELDVLGPVSLTQALLPHMIERKQGHIAVTSSLAGKIGVTGMRSYCGSKYALQGYFESLRYEMYPNNIGVTLICPGPVVSKIAENSFTGNPKEVSEKPFDSSEKPMATDRCAYLSCVAIVNRVYETWMCHFPPLLLVYLMLLFPESSHRIVAKEQAKRLEAARR